MSSKEDEEEEEGGGEPEYVEVSAERPTAGGALDGRCNEEDFWYDRCFRWEGAATMGARRARRSCMRVF